MAARTLFSLAALLVSVGTCQQTPSLGANTTVVPGRYIILFEEGKVASFEKRDGTIVGPDQHA